MHKHSNNLYYNFYRKRKYKKLIREIFYKVNYIHLNLNLKILMKIIICLLFVKLMWFARIIKKIIRALFLIMKSCTGQIYLFLKIFKNHWLEIILIVTNVSCYECMLHCVICVHVWVCVKKVWAWYKKIWLKKKKKN